MASTSPVVSQSLEKELHRRYNNREIKIKRVLQIRIAKKTNPTNPSRAVTWEEKGKCDTPGSHRCFFFYGPFFTLERY